MAQTAVPGESSAEGSLDPVVRRMGYQPALDGLRALSVALVILYHAGVVHNAGLPSGMPRPWFFNGGFLGVEVFFVVSGYLITTLLLEERAQSGTVSLRAFWVRRFRRLMPALWAMVAVVSVWAMVWGHRYLDDLRSDVPYALTYTSNFQQLFRKVSYFEGLPHLLRHLWSLAVEEHFYVLFPPVAALVMRRPDWSPRRLLRVVVPAAAVSVVFLAVIWQRPFERLTDTGVQLDDLRQNWAYLSTISRAGGILIGVALAIVWSPWARRSVTASQGRAVAADVLGSLAVAGVVLCTLLLSNESAFLYRGGLTLVSLLSAVAIAMAVHPGARFMRAMLGNRAMAAVGRRSYGLYLWHWPVFVGPLGQVDTTWLRLVIGVPVTIVVSELCYRFVETPLRRGGLLARLRRQPAVLGAPLVLGIAAITVGLVVVRPGGNSSADAVGIDDSAWVEAGEEPTADSATVVPTEDTAPSSASVPEVGPQDSLPSSTQAPVDAASESSTSALATTTTIALLPRRVVTVGDSTAGMLARNMPKATARTLQFFDGSLSGCSINDSGIAFGKYKTGRDFRVCRGWQKRWADKSKKYAAEIVLVVIGAWDVFNIDYGRGRKVYFGTPEYEGTFMTRLRTGIDAVLETGAKVALLEIPCYRPHSTGGPGTFEYPERRDDANTRRLSELLRSVASSDPGNVTFITGPTVWCTDEKIATNLWYRYDGVHYSPRGSSEVYKAIKDQLLAIPVDAEQHEKKPRR